MVEKHVAVLFSGGRDSSLAACLMAMRGYKVHLLSFVSGFGVKSEIAEYRFDELRNRFPNNITGRVIIPIFGLVRKIATLNIEQDFAKYKVNLILVGEKLAMHAASTVYCLQNDVELLVDGTSGYQSDGFPEQMPQALEMFRAFHAEYKIRYECPILDFNDDDSVKYLLMEIGISTKSLEGITMFAETFSKPSPEVLQAYIKDKLPSCRQYVSLLTSGTYDFREKTSPNEAQ